MTNTSCNLCPRACGINRLRFTGFCGGGKSVKVARAALHFWEEPCISGKNGSGTVFFSGCHLRCVYCQNAEISHDHFGVEITVSRLAEIFKELEAQGAHNINLVSGTHYIPEICDALALAHVSIPVVYNSSGYETLSSIQKLQGFVDIFLPDLKYYSSTLSLKYSGAADYFEVASVAIQEMARISGKPKFNAEGILQKGTIVRHLILPGAYKDSLRLLDWLEEVFSPEDILISLMRQFTPYSKCESFPELNRRLTTFEYQKVSRRLCKTAFQGYLQEKSAAKKEYTPLFDLTGI